MTSLIQPFLLESLPVLAVLLIGPALMVWTSRDAVTPRRVAMQASVCAVSAALAASLLLPIREGQGLTGLVLLVGGLIAAAVALVFFSAAVTSALALAVSGGSTAGPAGRRGGSRPTSAPLTEEFRAWQRETRRPGASYQDFLRDAHPRRFPPSALTLIGALIAMVVVFIVLAR